MKNKAYTKEEKQVVKDWAVKWLQFLQLINNVTVPSQSPPTEEEEITFQKLRQWFMENERTFIPIWNDFCHHRMQDCTDKISADELEALDEDNFVAFLKNPFSFYYRPGTLYLWAHHIGLQYTIVAWEPDEQQMRKVRPILGFLAKVLVEEFADWVDA